MKIEKEAGFTLVELLTVVAIIGVLSGIVSLNLVGEGKKNRVKEATTRLYSDLKKCRVDAMSRSHYPNSRGYGFKFINATTYQTFEFDDVNDDYHYGNVNATNTTAETKDSITVSLPNGVQVKAKSSGTTPDKPFFFDRRGWLRNEIWSSVGETFILELDGAKPRCIVLSTSRIRQGVWDNAKADPNKCSESN